jgi:hypothetical protein
MDNQIPSKDIPHPEWIGWSNNKRECMTDANTSPKKSFGYLEYLLCLLFIVILVLLIWLFVKK